MVPWRVSHPAVTESKSNLQFKRVVVKLSGEALASRESGAAIDTTTLSATAAELAEVRDAGIQVAVVVGGGNIFRGLRGAGEGMDRAQSDYMGMLATVINSLALQDALERRGVPTRVMTAIEIRQVAELYIRRRAIRHLDRGHVVICAAGTGNPYFSTDTAAALRAAEMGCDIILMAKQGVDGVYDADPRKHPEARRYETLSFDEAIQRNLRVMDQTALALCRENSIPIIVFDSNVRGNIQKVAAGASIGTTVGE